MISLSDSYNNYLYIYNNKPFFPLVLVSDTNTVDKVIVGPNCNLNNTQIYIIPTICESIEDGCLLNFAQENVAHNICQLIYNYYYIVKKQANKKLYVTNFILNMPLILNLVKLIFNDIDIIILKDNILYKCTKIYLSKFTWFWGDYFGNSPNKMPIIDINNDVRTFMTGEQNSATKNLPFIYFNDYIDTIFENNKHKYKTYDNIAIMKTNLNTDSTTPKRCINMSSNVKQLLEENNYFIFIPHLITDIIEYIVLLKSAKNVITSYGGANCINRFFFTNSIVKVICNKHYQKEYKNISHNVLSTYKSKNTHYFLDISNDISEFEIMKVICY